MKKPNLFLSLIILLLLGAGGAFLYSLNAKITHLNGQIEHMDEEVDEAASGVKRLLDRGEQAGDRQNNQGLEPGGKAGVDSKEFDFGRVDKKGGKVETTFSINNDGAKELRIGTITTSCGCTSAEIDKTNIASGQKATLTVTFDPDFHEEPRDRFSRSIFVPTGDPNNTELEFKIFVDIIE